jgi:hypothetical protein
MYFAITGEQEAALMATRDDTEVRAFIEDVEMGDWDGEPLDCETDKAWDAIHRCLSDGTLGCGRRLSPLDLAVLGADHHHDGDDYIVAHLRAGEVAHVAAARSSSPSISDQTGHPPHAETTALDGVASRPGPAASRLCQGVR